MKSIAVTYPASHVPCLLHGTLTTWLQPVLGNHPILRNV